MHQLHVSNLIECLKSRSNLNRPVHNLLLRRCSNIFKADVDRIIASLASTKVIWDGIERDIAEEQAEEEEDSDDYGFEYGIDYSDDYY